MWHKLQKQVAVEREQLNYLIKIHSPLLVKCASTQPDAIELSALAALLHSFYTGIENIFKRVAVEVDGTPPRGETWHGELLDSMTRANTARRAVISSTLRDRLRGYLDFRHVFRHAYSFQLRWEKMSQIVLGCEETLHQIAGELDSFFESSATERI